MIELTILSVVFSVLLFWGVPVSFCIGIATLLALFLTFFALATLAAVVATLAVLSAVVWLATADFVNHRDHDWSTARLVVEHVRQFVLNFLLHNVKVNLASVKGTGNFLLQVLANDTHELFTVAQVNESAANDVWARHKASTSLLYRQHNHEDTFVAHVNTVFKDHF